MTSFPTRQSTRSWRGLIALVFGSAFLAACGAGTGGDEGADRAVPSTPPVSTAVAVPSTAPAPVCVVTVEPGDSMIAIANRTGVPMADIEAENALVTAATIHPGQVFDICTGNDIDDVTGASRIAPPIEAVITQQTELNELFASTSLPPLVVDGDSGSYTRQAICVARMGLGLPVHNGHLTAGSDEEAAIFAATTLAIPAGAPTDAAKWILVDQTCQVIFTGEGDDRVVGVFPTSTGQPGFETRTVSARAFRFDPAIDNDGWHDSATFPVEGDNPLNGNMYKPLYFNDGQAIHGAGFIPPDPRSKGCARTFPKHQDMMVEWLGLKEETEATWDASKIGVTVVVQGRYQDRTAD
jgi:hypothetical protein